MTVEAHASGAVMTGDGGLTEPGWRARTAIVQRRAGAVVVSSVVLATVSVTLAVTSDHVEHRAATALYYGYLVVAPMLVGAYWNVRRPGSRFGWLLVAFGLSAWLVSWQSANWAVVFDLGVLADGIGFFLTFYLFLAFPTGRLVTLANRLLIAGLAGVVLGFFLPWALLAPEIAGRGPLAACHAACPGNVLQIAADPGAVAFAYRWATYSMLAMTVLVLAVYSIRIATASRPRRRALIAVAATSLLFLPIFFVFHFAGDVLHVDPATREVLAWALVGIRVLLPVGFLVALLQADLFAGAARGRLLDQLVRHPSPGEWRDAVACALDDPPLQLAYWDPDASSYRGTDGTTLRPPPAGGRVIVTATRRGAPVAAMVIDEALAEDPELVHAATSATVLAVENGSLEGELRATQARVREVGAQERKRIERDLHDSAQQRLIALRISLELASERSHGSEQAELRRFGNELDQVIDEVRMAAAGAQPAPLALHGVAVALRSLAASMPIVVHDRGFGRRPDAIETAVFYCCAEALQNASKHAGQGARATVHLTGDAHGVLFAVEDDGIGFDLDSCERGRGIENLNARMSAVGGTLVIESVAGRGTRVSGRISIDDGGGASEASASPAPAGDREGRQALPT